MESINLFPKTQCLCLYFDCTFLILFQLTRIPQKKVSWCKHCESFFSQRDSQLRTHRKRKNILLSSHLNLFFSFNGGCTGALLPITHLFAVTRHHHFSSDTKWIWLNCTFFLDVVWDECAVGFLIELEFIYLVVNDMKNLFPPRIVILQQRMGHEHLSIFNNENLTNFKLFR